MIDLRNTWCEAIAPNHDKLRLLGFNHEPINWNINYYIIDENYEITSIENKVMNDTYKQIHLVDDEFQYVKQDNKGENMKDRIPKFNLEKLRGKKVVVNCTTEEQAQTFVNWVVSLGVDTLLTPYWEDYKEDSCYGIAQELYWLKDFKKGAKQDEYEVISYEDALDKELGENMKDKIKEEFIEKVKTECIGVRINSEEELNIWYNFLDKYMDKSLGRYHRPFIKGYIYSNSKKYKYIMEYTKDNGFYEKEGFTIYDFKDILDKNDKKGIKYLVQVKGKGQPKVRHSYECALKEAKRLCKKEAPTEVYVLEVKKTFKSEVVVTEL